jgi:hypothetical protein
MARNTADACMFCGENHSGNCGGTAAKKSAPKVTRVRPEKPAQPVAPQPTQRAESSKPDEVSVFDDAGYKPAMTSIARVRDPQEEELSRAITVLADADLLHHEELDKHRDRIKLPSYRINAMIWKQVNSETVAANQSDQRPAREQ